jgi:hypothetical protein
MRITSVLIPVATLVLALLAYKTREFNHVRAEAVSVLSQVNEYEKQHEPLIAEQCRADRTVWCETTPRFFTEPFLALSPDQIWGDQVLPLLSLMDSLLFGSVTPFMVDTQHTWIMVSTELHPQDEEENEADVSDVASSFLDNTVFMPSLDRRMMRMPCFTSPEDSSTEGKPVPQLRRRRRLEEVAIPQQQQQPYEVSPCLHQAFLERRLSEGCGAAIQDLYQLREYKTQLENYFLHETNQGLETLLGLYSMFLILALVYLLVGSDDTDDDDDDDEEDSQDTDGICCCCCCGASSDAAYVTTEQMCCGCCQGTGVCSTACPDCCGGDKTRSWNIQGCCEGGSCCCDSGVGDHKTNKNRLAVKPTTTITAAEMVIYEGVPIQIV